MARSLQDRLPASPGPRSALGSSPPSGAPSAARQVCADDPRPPAGGRPRGPAPAPSRTAGRTPGSVSVRARWSTATGLGSGRSTCPNAPPASRSSRAPRNSTAGTSPWPSFPSPPPLSSAARTTSALPPPLPVYLLQGIQALVPRASPGATTPSLHCWMVTLYVPVDDQHDAMSPPLEPNVNWTDY